MTRNLRGPTLRFRRRAAGLFACAKFSDGPGRSAFLSFGPKDDPETAQRFARAVLCWRLAGHRVDDAVRAAAFDARPAGRSRLTLGELIDRFLAWAKEHYRGPDGAESGETYNAELTCRPLKESIGAMLADDFGPKALAAFQHSLIAKGLARKTINQRVGIIRRLFRWAAKHELIPAETWHGLQAVEGLQRGRCGAKEGRGVKPAPLEHVERTLPHLSPMLRAMVELTLATGMRVSETCTFRLDETDTSGDVWIYKPKLHKNAWRGRERVVAIGPKGQAAIQSVMRPGAQTGYLFDPRVAEAQRWAAQRDERETPLWPSHVEAQARRKAERERRILGEHYDAMSFAQAIRRACRAAGVPRWSPGQLRHTFATEARKSFGLEVARALLGHARVETTQVYAEVDEGKARAAAQRIG